MTIVFATKSNIATDARILRSMDAISNGYLNFDVIGVGVINDVEKHKSSIEYSYKLFDIELTSKRIRIIPVFIRHLFIFIELNFKFLKFYFKNNPDVIHVNDFHPLFSALIYKYLKSTKIIYDAHELESETNGLRKFYSRVIKNLEKLSWGSIELLITPSQTINSWYVNQFGDKPNVVILNTPYKALNNLEYNINYLRERYAIDSKHKIFIYVGILGLGRGIERCIDVFTDIEITSHLVFLGYGQLEILIKESAEKCPNIHYHEPVSHELVTNIARSADVGLAMIENVSLSDYYCAPNKLFEYAFSGIYIVASDFPEMRRIVLNHNLGELVINDKLSLLNKVKEIESRISVELERVNLEELSWTHQADLLVESYGELLKT